MKAGRNSGFICMNGNEALDIMAGPLGYGAKLGLNDDSTPTLGNKTVWLHANVTGVEFITPRGGCDNCDPGER